jgi:gluconolactonase
MLWLLAHRAPNGGHGNEPRCYANGKRRLIFWVEDTGKLKLLTTKMVQPTGLAFSLDGKRLYMNDTPAREIRVYDFISGEMKTGRFFAKEPVGRGGPDGMKGDVQGNVWVIDPDGIWLFDPAGTHLGTIVLIEGADNFVWENTDFSTLYFCGLSSMYKLKAEVKGFVPVDGFETYGLGLESGFFPPRRAATRDRVD